MVARVTLAGLLAALALYASQGDRLYKLVSTRIETGFTGVADYNLTAEDCAREFQQWQTHASQKLQAKFIIRCEVQ